MKSKKEDVVPSGLSFTPDEIAAIYATVFVKLESAFIQCDGDPEKIPAEGREYYKNLASAYKAMAALSSRPLKEQARIMKGYE
jgi:hypothetical protein